MFSEPDDLEKLLSDVKRSINENRQFLESLLNDAVDGVSESGDEEDKDQEAFEEL